MLEPDIRRYVQLLPEEDKVESNRHDQLIPIDAYLAQDELHLEFDLPGVERDQIHVRVESHLVVVEGTRTTSRDSLSDPLISTRAHGNFHCRLVLGDRCDVDQLNASLADGVLSITVPLSVSPATRQVVVTGGMQSPGAIATGVGEPDQVDRSLVSVT